MRIVVICGAGASSTFVATRLQRAAEREGIALTAMPAALPDLPVVAELADGLLLASHLAPTTTARAKKLVGDVPILSLPSDIASDIDGTRVLSVVRPILPTSTESAQQ